MEQQDIVKAEVYRSDATEGASAFAQMQTEGTLTLRRLCEDILLRTEDGKTIDAFSVTVRFTERGVGSEGHSCAGDGDQVIKQMALMMVTILDTKIDLDSFNSEDAVLAVAVLPRVANFAAHEEFGPRIMRLAILSLSLLKKIQADKKEAANKA
jgi:hypothetical protein